MPALNSERSRVVARGVILLLEMILIKIKEQLLVHKEGKIVINNRIVKSTSMAAVVSMLVGTAFAAGVVPAYAGEVTNNDITITAAAHGQSAKPDMAARTFKAYKIASYTNVSFDGAGNNRHAIGYDLTGVVPEADMKTAIKAAVGTQWNGVVAANGDSIKFVGDAANLNAYQFVAKYFYGTGSDVYGNAQADKAEMRKFANALMDSHSLGNPATAPVTVAGDTATVAVPDNGGEGIYLIVETSDHTDGNTVSRAMVTGSPFKDGNKFVDTLVNGNVTYTLGKLTLKADKVTVDKETYKTGDSENPKDQLVGVGSKRGFQITTNVPEYMNAYQDWVKSGKAPVFSIGDNPSNNVTPDRGTIEVYKGSVANANKLTLNTDYTVTDGNADDPNDFSVNLTTTTTKADTTSVFTVLDAEKLKALSGQKIIVRYNATVNSLADTTDNTTTVNFSNDPYEDKNGTVTDNERSYEADLNLKKVAWNNTGSQLDGAEFQVWKGKAAGDANAVLKFNKAGNDYVLANGGTDNKVVFGSTTLKGLAADSDTAVTYHFKETKAPAGYILGENPVEFNVTLTPTFGGDGELQKVAYSINSVNHGNFIDLTHFTANGVNAPASGNTVIVDANPAIVENTTNIKDFAKTGGEIIAYIAIALGLAVAGSLTAAVARRNRARKTA